VGYLFFVGHDAAHRDSKERLGKLTMPRNQRPPEVRNGDLYDVVEEPSEEEDERDVLVGEPERRPSLSFGQSMRSVFTTPGASEFVSRLA